MPKSDLGDVCRRYLPSRLSKQTDSSLLNDQLTRKTLLNNESISSAEISIEELLFDKMPANNDVLLTTFNPSTNTNGNGTNGNHSYRSTYVSCSSANSNGNGNGNGNHSNSSPSSSSSSSSPSYADSSSLMMNWELLKDRGSGLVNLGNTCFINASLQCLANTPPLVQWILSNSHNKCCRVKLEKQFCLFCEAERIVKSMHSKTSNSSFSSSSAGAADPNNIVRRIRDISTTFKVGRQEDASEFLICLIDKIVDACLRSSQPPERLRPSSGTSYEQLCHSQTIFHDLFGLVLRSRVDCSRCRQTSDTFEVQYAWIVSVRNQHDLRLSLEQFVSREILSGENLYRCMKCKQLVQAAKRYTLHKASKILLVNLKRFEFGKNSHKLSHSVRYPEYLDVRPYMSDETVNEQSLTYRLYAVLVHIGASMHSGHYFSFVRSPNNHWYKADDTTMTQCELNQVLNHSGAYILCYIKETAASSSTSTPPPSTPTSKIVYQNGKPMNNSESTLIRTATPKSVTMFTPRQVTVSNLSKQINGHNGCTKPVTSTLTKPSIVSSTTSDSTNGNGTLSTAKREPIVMRIPNISQTLMSSALQKKSIFASNSVTTSTPSKLVNKLNSTPIVSTTTMTQNSNFTISSTTSLSSVQSTSSPLKLIIKTSGSSTGLNGLASICKSYNQNDDDEDEDDDDDDDDHDNSSETVEPAKKKVRVDDVSISSSLSTTADSLPPLASSSSSLSSTSPHPTVPPPPPPLPSSSSSSSQSNPTADEQQITSSTTKHKKKKKKKKSHKHHHHHRHHRHKTHHHRHHHRRSRSRSRSRSLSYSPVGSPAYSNSSSSESTHRSHRKTKKHHRHKRSRSSTTSRSSRESS